MSDVYLPDRLKAEIEAEPWKLPHILAALAHRDRRTMAAERRADRLAQARVAGGHRESEWAWMAVLFASCARCGATPCGKDHIVPLSAGGCDCIANIQPLCVACNSAKGPVPVDYRNLAMPGWVATFIAGPAPL